MAYPVNACAMENLVLDVVVADPIIPVAEAITLAQAKHYLKMEGINDDDDIITELITEARIWAEKFCAISILSKTVTAILQVKNRIELPYGPVIDISAVVIKDRLGNIVVPGCTTIVGLDGGFPHIAGYGQFQVEYDAGYPIVPADLIGAMLAYIAFAYEHRGDDLEETEANFAPIARKKAFRYKRQMGF